MSAMKNQGETKEAERRRRMPGEASGNGGAIIR